MSATKYWLWLSSVAASPKTKRLILDRYTDDPMLAYYAPPGEYETIPGINKKELAPFEARDLDAAMRILDACSEQGLDIITRQDAAYPRRLLTVYAPPDVLYVRGRLPVIDEEAAVAIVGTRRATPYGLKMARGFGYQITKCGGLVVSGLTAGCDAAGAQGALRAGGAPIGVLGVAHECDNGRLSADVAAVGALLSEYPPGTTPQTSFFRARNRLTYGLCVGVAAIEAPERSGTRLFVNEAADCGREIFALPGNADAVSCAGTNAILKEGAKPVTDAWEIMCEFAERFPARVKNPGEGVSEVPEMPAAEPEIDENSPARTKKVIDKPKTTGYIDLQTQLKELTPEQLQIVAAMTEPEMHIDDITEKAALPAQKTLAGLTLLQIKGYVTQHGGKRFTLNIKSK